MTWYRALWALPVLAFSALAQPTMNIPLTAIALSADPNPVVYATPGTGLLRSTDGGLTWRALFLRPAGQRQPAVRNIVTDIANPQTVYVGTDLDDGALWKSTDGGNTWANANQGLPIGAGSVENLWQVPKSPQILYIKIGGQLFKSINGAATWALQSKLPAGVTAVAINFSNVSEMYAAQLYGVAISTDEGVTWRGARNNIAGIKQGTGIVSIVVDESQPRTFVLSAVGATGGAGIYFSTDGGDSINLRRGSPQFATALYFSPQNPRVLFAAALEPGIIYRSDNGGANWGAVPVGAALVANALALHPKDLSLVWAATTRGAFASTDGGSKAFSARGGVVKPTISGPVINYQFALAPNSQGRLDLPINVVETDRWSVPLQVAASGGAWLTTTGVTGSTPATVQVRVNTAGLDPGEYQGTVRISSTQAANDTVTVPVKLTVAVPDAPPPYTISTLVGTGQVGRFGDGNLARFAGLANPDSIAVDRDGNVLISDTTNNNVRRVTTDGYINRFAGTNDAGYTGDGGAANLASMRAPSGLAIDPNNGWTYVVDTGNKRVRRVSPDGGIFGFTQDDIIGMRGIAVDNGGNVYVAVPVQNAVGKITPDGTISRFAGTGLSGYRIDGVAADVARLSGPTDVAVDKNGNVYIADTENQRIRVVGRDGLIRTVAGNGVAGFQGDGVATAVALGRPTGIAVDDAGNIFVADSDNNRIRMITPDGFIRTIAGTGVAGFSGDNGPASAATFRSPVDVAVWQGNVYVIDSQNVRVRALAPPPRAEISGSVVNAADLTAALAPGSVFIISGKNFAKSAASASGDWQPTLGAVQAKFGDRPALLSSVSPTEIRGQVPIDAPPGATAVQVITDQSTSAPFAATLLAAAPAIFNDPPGRAVAFNEDGTRNSPDAPALTGSILRVYTTGLGNSGVLPTAMVGDAACEVLATNSVEGMPGVTEVQLRLPASLPAGDAALVIQVGDAASAPAAISVTLPPTGPSA